MFSYLSAAVGIPFLICIAERERFSFPSHSAGDHLLCPVLLIPGAGILGITSCWGEKCTVSARWHERPPVLWNPSRSFLLRPQQSAQLKTNFFNDCRFIILKSERCLLYFNLNCHIFKSLILFVAFSWKIVFRCRLHNNGGLKTSS